MKTSRPTLYKPIRDYGLISDMITAALVGLDGSIDWLCWPRFDSPSIFGALLDANKGGKFYVKPAAGPWRSEQQYIPNTNVLITKFKTAKGSAEVLDFFIIDKVKRGLYRLVRGLSGQVVLEIVFEPRFNYGLLPAKLSTTKDAIIAKGNSNVLELYSDIPLKIVKNQVKASLNLSAGEEKILVMGEKDKVDCSLPVINYLLKQTINYWKQWLFSWTYDGPWSNYVARSALLVKALTYKPTGLMVAAPTTSLPEKIGGNKNWDYRYVWLRDAAMVLEAMFHLGHMQDVGKRFINFLVQQGGEDPSHLRIMYAVDGKPLKNETFLSHLEGYQSSKPVRIGNKAASQFQLDVYGEILYCIRRYLELAGKLTPSVWRTVIKLSEQIVNNWQKPDKGVWEERGQSRHYTHSKVMCAVGLRSALLIQKQTGYPAPTKRWLQTLSRINKNILEKAWSQKLNAFTKAFGLDEVDASCLLMSVYDFLPATNEYVRATADRIIHTLGYKGLLYRFKYAGEELGESEGAFTIASLWLAIHFIKLGQLDFAAQYIQAIIDSANHLGLFSEEIDAKNGEFLGNFPQLFVHTALIDAVHTYNSALRQKKQLK